MKRFAIMLLCAALGALTLEGRAQVDPNKTILEQLYEFGPIRRQLQEDAQARYRKIEEERAAKMRALEKLPPEQRAIRECEDAETDEQHKCRGTYLRQGYKDVWRNGDWGGNFVIMQGNTGAVACFSEVAISDVTRCQPLRRLQ